MTRADRSSGVSSRFARASDWLAAYPDVSRAALVFFFALVLLARSYPVYFMGDDFDFFRSFERSVEGLADVLTFQFWGLYEPVFTLTFFLDHSLAGYDPALFHLTSNLLYALTGVLVYFLLVTLAGGRRDVALVGALWFVADPLHDEPVLYLAARAHVLALAFSTLALLLFVRARQRGADRFFPASFVAFAIAFLAKESALLLPVLVAAIDFLFLPRNGGSAWRAGLRSILRGATYVGIAVVYLLLRMRWIEVRGEKLTQLPDLENLWERLSVYFLIQHAPLPFSTLPETTIEQFRGAGFMVMLALLAVLAWAWMRSRGKPSTPLRLLIFGYAWFLVGMVPMLSPSISTHRRYLYFASLGAAILFAGLYAALAEQRWLPEPRRRWAGVGAALAVVVLAVMFVGRVELYRDATALIRRTIDTIRAEAGGRSVVALPILPYKYRLDSLNGGYLLHPTDLNSAVRLFVDPNMRAVTWLRLYYAEDVEATVRPLGRGRYEMVVRCPARWDYDHFLERVERYVKREDFFDGELAGSDATARNATVRFGLDPRYAARTTVLGYSLGEYRRIHP